MTVQKQAVRWLSDEETRLVNDLMKMSGPDDVDPHPHFARLRRESPVYQGDIIRELGGRSALATHEGPIVSVAAYEDVAAVLKDNTTFSSEALNPTLGRAYGRTLLTMDPPDHTAVKRVLRTVFSPRALNHWRREYFEPLFDAFLDSIAADGGGDLLARAILPFPVAVLHQLYGLPEEEIGEFHTLAIKLLMVRAPDPTPAFEAAQTLYERMTELVAQRRSEAKAGKVGNDIVSQILRVNDESNSMTDEEVVFFLRLLLPAGAETTQKATANTLIGLLSDRAQWDQLVADPQLAAEAVDEGLRWENSVTGTFRIAVADSELRGIAIPAGTAINALIASANRDENYFPDKPNEYRLNRRPGGVLAFGHGIHLCLGHHVARFEMITALNRLATRFPNLRFDDALPAPRMRGLTFRAPDHLHVKWE